MAEYGQKFRRAGPTLDVPPDFKTRLEKFPRLHFLYASLTEPGLLSDVIGLSREPELLPAKVLGFRLILQGTRSYLTRKAGETAAGVMHEIHSLDEQQKLLNYESEASRDTLDHEPQSNMSSKPVVTLCQIFFDDGTKKIGSTVVWE